MEIKNNTSLILKEIPNLNGEFYAGNNRHIYRMFYRGKKLEIPKMLKEWKRGNKYLYACPRMKGSPRNKDQKAMVHRLVLQAFCGPMPKEAQVARHLDGNPLNNKPENLKWGTYCENEADKREHGRIMSGTRHHHAKLTEEAIKIIRASIPFGLWETNNAAKVFGVGRSLIAAIARGNGWNHVTNEQ